jgi:hypothetical protein
MTNIDTLAKAAIQTLSSISMPQIRVAVPALTRRKASAKRVEKSVSQLERDDLMELFQSDLSEMTSLKENSAHKNVIPMRAAYSNPFAGLGHAA